MYDLLDGLKGQRAQLARTTRASARRGRSA